MRYLPIVALLAVLAGTGGSAAAAPAARAAASAAPAVRAHGPLPWVADDFPRAVALAKARKLPIFVEAWAPW